MNYIRGAVNAISAPYLYYKELSPINPSTLTGAIDVIVIQRPSPDGSVELACSPFHVRFGKWQVLRPAEKKVSVSVNGQLIPYNMKIGDAGEAFFVFETLDDIPADLITSPIILPTVAPLTPTHEIPEQDPTSTENDPDFLDLDAPTPIVEETKVSFIERNDTQPDNVTPKQMFTEPKFQRTPSSGSLRHDSLPQSFSPRSDSYTSTMGIQDKLVDDTLALIGSSDQESPEVEYHPDIALDIEGYHAHPLNQRRHSSEGKQHSFPSYDQARHQEQPTPPEPHSVQPTRHISAPQPPSLGPIRATSEPPPEGDETSNKTPVPSHLTPLHVQEYSWEWGAFPQPSPVKTTFGKDSLFQRTGTKSKRRRIQMHLHDLEDANSDLRKSDEKDDDEVLEHEHEHLRSRSVPPALDGIPIQPKMKMQMSGDSGEEKERFRHQDEMSSYDKDSTILDSAEEVKRTRSEDLFGAGARLSARRSDSGCFILSLDGRNLAFELSKISPQEGYIDYKNTVNAVVEGEKIPTATDATQRKGSGMQKWAQDEVEAAQLFEHGRITFDQFLDDEDLQNDPYLVIRWPGDQYITRDDGSPLMDALVRWRTSSLQQRTAGVLRPVSPLALGTTDELGVTQNNTSQKGGAQEDDVRYGKIKKTGGTIKKPTSLSWVQWWSRSRQEERNVKEQGDRPGMRSTASAPIALASTPGRTLRSEEKNKATEEHESGSAPALPSTPLTGPSNAIITPVPSHGRVENMPIKKFAKTLRLTSDQLKALNLKPGSNSVTFSLSTSGVIACTARIFLWDSTDMVVVSDIDGTITKSDGLGHVFAMIGRDWTHLGVAKLYTDITRNGYKIMYLTSRAIGQADATRGYLKGIKQNNYQLPEGPVIMSPDRLMASLHREVIMRKPEVFKMACLRDIQRLFGESARNPFYAGFGNRITDALSYRSVNVPSARIFTIDSTGEVKMELLELAGYKSSYIHMTDLVDQMFPPIHRKWTPEFTDFNYWKQPLQDYPLPDFSPPSPTLSARSDTSSRSALARLRNFSLGSRSRQNTIKPVGGDFTVETDGNPYNTNRLLHITSFEKLSNTLSTAAHGLRRSVSPESYSPTYASSDDEDMSKIEEGAKNRDRERRHRRTSMTSMPGSLDDIHFGLDEDEMGREDDKEYDYAPRENYGDESDNKAAADDTFDEDLLAAVEMRDVPFI